MKLVTDISSEIDASGKNNFYFTPLHEDAPIKGFEERQGPFDSMLEAIAGSRVFFAERTTEIVKAILGL